MRAVSGSISDESFMSPEASIARSTSPQIHSMVTVRLHAGSTHHLRRPFHQVPYRPGVSGYKIDECDG
jgi:hypothetical protein